MLTGLRYRLVPTRAQERVMRRSGGACRWLWNWALAQRNAAYRGSEGRVKVGWVDQAAQLKHAKAHYPFLADAPFHALQQTLRDLDRAFVNFFEGRAAFPAFRRRRGEDAFRFPDPKQFAVEGDRVCLPKLGRVRLRLSRPITGQVRHITISREGDEWYASFCCEGEYPIASTLAGEVGLDAGVKQDIATSDAAILDLGPPTREERKRLRHAQRTMARRQRGSRRWEKALARVGKLRRRWARRRRDRAHKASTYLVRRNRLVVVEDLRIKNMTASAAGTIEEPGRNVAAKRGLNREMLARGHADFRRMLAYKCERAGVRFLAVPAFYTSQRCSRCGHVAPENRESQAVFRCVACAFTANADVNAALNILAAGRVAIAREGRHDPVSPSSGQTVEPRTQPRDPVPAGLAGNPAKSRHAA